MLTEGGMYGSAGLIRGDRGCSYGDPGQVDVGARGVWRGGTQDLGGTGRGYEGARGTDTGLRRDWVRRRLGIGSEEVWRRLRGPEGGA